MSDPDFAGRDAEFFDGAPTPEPEIAGARRMANGDWAVKWRLPDGSTKDERYGPDFFVRRDARFAPPASDNDLPGLAFWAIVAVIVVGLSAIAALCMAGV